MITFQGAYSEIINYDWDEYELFLKAHNEYKLEKIIIEQYKHSGSKITYEKYKENYKYLKKEFEKEDNEIKDWTQYIKMCRSQGWRI